MRVLFVGGHQPAQMLGTLYRGAERLGHEVRHVMCIYHEGDPEAIRAAISDFAPDVIWGFIPYTWFRDEILEIVAASSAVKVYWDFDWPQAIVVNEPGVSRAVPFFDVVVSVDDSSIAQQFCRRMGKPMFWLPPLFDAQQEIREAPRTDVLFMGHGYHCGMFSRTPLARTQRVELMEAVSFKVGAGRVTIRGGNWPSDWAGEKIAWDDHFGWFTNATVNLGQFCLIAPGYSRHLNFRPTVCLGSGGFLLQEWHQGLDECFQDGREIVYWRGVDEAAELCAHYLQHPDAAARIGAAGRKRVLQEYEASDWMAKALRWVTDQAR